MSSIGVFCQRLFTGHFLCLNIYYNHRALLLHHVAANSKLFT